MYELAQRQHHRHRGRCAGLQGRGCLVCQGRRLAPDIARLKQLIDAGRIGAPILCSGYVKWYRPPDYYADSRWRGTRALDGGGALMNQGVHTIDLLLWLMGNVERVYAKTLTALHEIEVEDTVVATLEFRNGAHRLPGKLSRTCRC